MMPNGNQRHNWSVLLIGGNSGAGKTTLARELSRHFDVPWLQVDDFRLMLEHYVSPDHEPRLHHFTDLSTVYRNSPEMLARWRWETAEIVSHATEKNVANHSSHGGPAILEGDDIVPSLAAKRTYAGLHVDQHDVAAVFLVEADEAAIEENMRVRGRDFLNRPEVERANHISMNLLYGHWLEREAAQLGLLVICPRLFDTLKERVLEKI